MASAAMVVVAATVVAATVAAAWEEHPAWALGKVGVKIRMIARR
jgi:hypothetical protein